MYEKFLAKLKEIREYEWNQYDLKLHEEWTSPASGVFQPGVRHNETALEAIARHMVEVLESEKSKSSTI